jgi:hypothetical protein
LKSTLATSLLDGTFHEESEHDGLVACIDTERPLTFDELSARLRTFGETGDLAALGGFRYAFARRDGSQTTVVTLWTDESAKLFDLFPETGDAPGRDPPDVPRPPASRRLLSGVEHGLPYSLTLYQVEQLAEGDVEDWYETALVEAGWELVLTRADRSLMARKKERTLSIHVGTTSHGQTFATVAELS